MSFTPNEYLNSDPVENIRCRQHASQTFVTDQFRLLPKDKFLFHVAFNVNWQALAPSTVETKLLETLKYEINLLVRSSDLPTYTVSAETLNQYNRKRVVQYQHKYNDIKISFHDDNMGLINQLWQTYYKHYYNDPTVSSKKGAYNKNATKKSSYITSPYGYVGKIKPFFNFITVYQMSRHEYVSYKIINPIITHWGGNNLAYHSSESHNFDMTLAYEAVSYGTGYVNDGQMEGFGVSHYDWHQSPLGSSYPANSGSYPAFPRSSLSGNSALATTIAKTSTAATGTSAAAGKASNLANTGTITTSASSSATTSSTVSQSTKLSNSTSSTSKIAGVSIPLSTTNTTTVASQITTNTGLAKAAGTTGTTSTALSNTANYAQNI